MIYVTAKGDYEMVRSDGYEIHPPKKGTQLQTIRNATARPPLESINSKNHELIKKKFGNNR